MTVSGNQRLRANAKSNRTSDPLQSPITPQEFAEFLGLIYDPSLDALLNSFLLAACDWYIKHSNNELLARDYVLKFDRYPESGDGLRGLGIEPAILADWITIPINPTSAVTAITANGHDILAEATIDLDRKPQRIQLDNPYQQDLVIEYRAGYETAAEIPASVILGLQMFASYLYEHRGACDADEAAKKSGALTVWQPEFMVLTL